MVALGRRAIAAACPLAAAAAAACLSTPSYQPPSLVTYTTDGAGATASGSDFALHFGSGGFHFPDALTIGGSDVIGHDTAQLCFDENGAGLQIAPTPRISADGGATTTQNQLEAVLRGPAVVQVRLTWTTHLACNRDSVPHGTSTFTVFPDGRIVRRDVVDDSNRVGFPPDGCACDPLGRQDRFVLSAYWTFARERFGDLVALDMDHPDPSAPLKLGLPDNGSDSTHFEPVCLDGPNVAGQGSLYQVASTWGVPADDAMSDYTALSGRTALVTYDAQRPIGNHLDLPWDIHGALFVEHLGCTRGLRRAKDYTDPAILRVNDAAVTASPVDGIYGGDRGDGSPPGIPVPGGRAALVGPLPWPFAVWLRFSSSVDTLRATLPRATGAWYTPQQIDGHNWIMWFRDPLDTGQTIVIEPQ